VGAPDRRSLAEEECFSRKNHAPGNEPACVRREDRVRRRWLPAWKAELVALLAEAPGDSWSELHWSLRYCGVGRRHEWWRVGQHGGLGWPPALVRARGR
jgi:hypothetical protein